MTWDIQLPVLGKTIVEVQRDPTTWRNGPETIHLEGILFGKLEIQTGPLFLSAPASDGDKVWGEDGWPEK